MRQARNSQRGISVIEMMAATVIVSVVGGHLASTLGTTQQRLRQEGAVAALRTDIAHARTLAVARSESVRVSFHEDESGTCYVVHSGNAGDCTCSPSGQASCSSSLGAKLFQSVAQPRNAGVAARANVVSMLFDAHWGTVTPTGTISVSGDRVGTIKLVVNIMGRVRLCTPDGAGVHVSKC